jgi:hypothetical protein
MKSLAMAVLLVCSGGAMAASGDEPSTYSADMGPPPWVDNSGGGIARMRMYPDVLCAPNTPPELLHRCPGYGSGQPDQGPYAATQRPQAQRPYVAPVPQVYPQYPDGRPAYAQRSRRDRDGDGVENRRDRYPDDPRRH